MKIDDLPDQNIIDCLNLNYNIDVLTLQFLPIGADMNSLIYKVETKDHDYYFLKLKQGHHHEIAIDIVELLHHAGIKQVILPLRTLNDYPTQRLDNYTLIVYPFIQGQDAFTRALTNEQWLTLGKTLRQIHDIEVPSPIQHRIRQEAYSPQWRESVRRHYAQMEDEPLEDNIALKLRTFMKENALAIHRVVDRAEQLAQQLRNESSKFVLCHSDIHGGNVLIDDNADIYLVDWDEPIMAPKERDLMFIGGGVGNVWNKAYEEKLFYQGYGKTEINRIILAYYRHERIVEDIALYGQDLLFTTSGGKNRLEMYQHFIAMFEPNGVVDIALKNFQTL